MYREVDAAWLQLLDGRSQVLHYFVLDNGGLAYHSETLNGCVYF
jgi:hypothetical protein